MTFLQLCQYVQRYIAAGNDLPGSYNPTSTQSQTGLYLEIVGWVQDAYRDIQQEESSWLFRQAAGTLTLTSGQATYTKAQMQAQLPTYERIFPYRNGDIRFVTATFGGYFGANCYFIPFDKWGGVVAQGQAPIPSTMPSVPSAFTVAPDESMAFYPVPTWTTGGPAALAFQYTKTIQNLINDADVPMWPSEWHDAIAWRAIKYWALVRESANKFALADAELQRIMRAMRASQLLDSTPTIEPAPKDTP